MAYISALADVQEFSAYSTITMDVVQRDVMPRVYYRSGVEFVAKSTFKTFDEGPLTGLICSDLSFNENILLAKSGSINNNRKIYRRISVESIINGFQT